MEGDSSGLGDGDTYPASSEIQFSDKTRIGGVYNIVTYRNVA